MLSPVKYSAALMVTVPSAASTSKAGMRTWSNATSTRIATA